MPEYTPYPNAKNTPNRKSRKGDRFKIFLANKEANRKLRKARKLAREAALEVQEETMGE